MDLIPVPKVHLSAFFDVLCVQNPVQLSAKTYCQVSQNRHSVSGVILDDTQTNQ